MNEMEPPTQTEVLAPPFNLRERLFNEAERELQGRAEVYSLGSRFEGVSPGLAEVIVLDVTKVPGCHYGLKNVFVPIIYHLENVGVSVGGNQIVVNPETAILVEPSTGNGWVAFSDAAEYLGYEHAVVMPDGLPEARYQHPKGRRVQIVKTPGQEYALGMPKQITALLKENRQRIQEGRKIFVSPNHPIGAANITVEAMSELGRQLMANVGNREELIRVVVSMGNGASLCALGEYVKRHAERAVVVATESLASGIGYDKFAIIRGLLQYRELYGIDPGNQDLMTAFSAYGTNAPIGVELPLQDRAIDSTLIDDYVLYADDQVLAAYRILEPSGKCLQNVLRLPNFGTLPRVLYEAFGNSTLANIAVAEKYINQGEIVVAMAYDGRANY